MINLLQETREKLKDNGKTSKDVLWVGNSQFKFSTLQRIFDGWKCSTDITLNMNSCDPTDEDVRSHEKYPFGPSRPDWMTVDDEQNMKEDFISMRKLIREIEEAKTDYVSIAINKIEHIVPMGTDK